MTRNNGCRLCVAGYAMKKKDLLKKRTAAEAANESASANTEDRLRGEGSKKREDHPARSYRTPRVEEGEGKAVAVDFGMG